MKRFSDKQLQTIVLLAMMILLALFINRFMVSSASLLDSHQEVQCITSVEH